MTLNSNIRLAMNKKDLDRVYRLTHECFVSAGLCHPQEDGKIIHFPNLDKIPETFIIVAELDGEIIGTNTVTIDGPMGLHTDPNFKQETDSIRNENRKIASSWRLAVDKKYSRQVKIVNSLIYETYKCVVENDVKTTLFTFYEKHERIYKRLINAESITKKRYQSEYYKYLPQVLMRWDIENAPKKWRAQ